MSLLRKQSSIAIVCMALLFAPAAHAIDADFTDIWWVPTESGWGVNLVQNDVSLFATFFIYGPNNTPTWYTGQMTFDQTTGVFAGQMFASTGTYFQTVPFNAAGVQRTAVGSVTFTPTSLQTGTLQYVVNNGAPVVKNIERTTFRTIPLSGTYSGRAIDLIENCQDPSQASTATLQGVQLTMQHTVATNAFRADVALSDGRSCTMTGTLTQSGQLYLTSSGSSTCGNAGTATQVAQLRKTMLGIEGAWRSVITRGSGLCFETFTFTGIRIQ